MFIAQFGYFQVAQEGLDRQVDYMCETSNVVLWPTPLYTISLAQKLGQFLHHPAIIGCAISGDAKELCMDVEFMEYSINMKSEVESSMTGRNMTKAEQILVINKIFINIMTCNGYSSVMKRYKGM